MTRVLAATFLLVLPLTASSGRVIIMQTNAAGDNIHLIDPATNTVVGEIKGDQQRATIGTEAGAKHTVSLHA